jgi:hypothetical protein
MNGGSSSRGVRQVKVPRSPHAKHPEYTRGFKFGYDAGSEMRTKYGRSFAEHQLDQLARNARRKGVEPATRAFDHGYVAGYRIALS